MAVVPEDVDVVMRSVKRHQIVKEQLFGKIKQHVK